jgi:LysR family transcriptional regulator, glycine cleavage system transcriptional activator
MGMLIRNPTLTRNLRAFCIAARHLSFKAAADALFLTPSAVSHQIRRLEGELGVRLFDRRARAVALTAAGAVFLEDVEPLLNAIDRTLERTAGKSSRGILRIAVPPFFASELLVPRLASLYALQRNLDIELNTQELRRREHAVSADASVLLTDSPPAELRTYRLLPLHLVVASSRGLAHVAREALPRALKSTPVVVHRARREAWRSWATATGLGPEVSMNVIEVDSWMAAVRAAERGLAIALVPSVLCAARFASGTLAQISAAEVVTRDAYYLAHRHEDGRRPEIRALVSWALAELRR